MPLTARSAVVQHKLFRRKIEMPKTIKLLYMTKLTGMRSVAVSYLFFQVLL